MGSKLYIGNIEVNITDSEYRRFHEMARRAGHTFRLLENGTIVNVSQISAIVPANFVPAATVDVDVPVSDLFEPMHTEGEVVEVIGPEDRASTRVTAADIKAVMDAKKITLADIAAATGYSTATVKMAAKGDRISQELSDIFRQKYLSGETPA